MKLIKIVITFVLIIITFSISFAAEKQGKVIMLHSGPISGKMNDGISEYLGIPFAAPPVGKLRWHPPQDVVFWSKIRRCVEFGPGCPQPQQNPGLKYSEDCLYLNVWSPAKSRCEKLPVMVWIHGGGFNFGSASQKEYYGKNLAKKGVVVVTINYRLGPLGFLAHSALSAESPYGVSGNYGLLDQIAALKWVNKNIAAFGGDPSNVTLFGQSAGSRSVSLHLISSLSAGLFHRAITQSGGPIMGSEYLTPAYDGNVKKALKMGKILAERLGCDSAADAIAAMRAKTADEIIKAADCKTGLFDEGLFFAPIFDGYVVSEDAVTAFSNKNQHKVPLIVGSTLNEGNNYILNTKDFTLKKYILFLKSRFSKNYIAAFQVFPAYNIESAVKALDVLISTAVVVQPAKFVAKSMHDAGTKAYLYRFSCVPATNMAKKAGAFHGVDLAYVFGNMSKEEGYTDKDFAVSKSVMAYWTNFAATGDPNGVNLLNWPEYDDTLEANMEFSNTIYVNTRLLKKECDFITSINKSKNELY